MNLHKFAAIAALSVGLAAPSSAQSIVSGDWISDCQRDGDAFVCQRYGGFFNGFPPGCDAGAIFLCRNVAFCELATHAFILSATGPAVLDARVLDCGETVNGRWVLTDIITL